MNKGAFLGLALITIGIFALMFNSNQSVFNFFSSETVTINESKVVNGDDITSIEIFSSSPSVYLIPADREDILVELNGEVSDKLKDSFSLDVQTSKDKLKVTVERSNTKITNFFGMIIIDTKLEVYVPEKMYDSIRLTTSSGKISIDDFQAKEIELRASSGTIDVSNVMIEKGLELQSSSGRIKVFDSQANYVDATASSGAVTINNIIAENIKATTSSGRIEFIDSEGEISAAASSGSITIDQQKLNGDINATTSSGKVEISLKEIESAIVDYKGSSGKGSVTIPGMVFEENYSNHIYGKVGSGDYEITVRTSSGGFDLN